MLPTVTAQSLHDALLAADSATAVLEALCGAPITIRRAVAGPATPPRCVADGQHRRVTLLCGARALSEADLWFRPGLLPPGMVAALATTDIPFGRVVASLGLRRHTLSARICERGAPFAVEHRAVLVAPDDSVVAEVAERYCWGLVSGGAS